MKRLILVNPVGRRSGFVLSSISRFPPLSLAYVAAVTPAGWDIKIIDENFGPCAFEEADLVGITAFTSSVGRAYEIAAEYRRRGVPVVIGGIHASMLPEEVLRYADAVVTGEIEGISGRNIFFLDDNLVGYSEKSRERAIAIFRGMIDRKMNKKWWMQASIKAADDDLLIRKAAESGGTHVFIGFETTHPEALRSMRKGINLKTGVENYHKVVERLHSHGIGVLGAFISGNDDETPEYYKELADFIVFAGVDMVQITILTPLPGTSLMEKMEAEGRLIYHDFPADWVKCRFSCQAHRSERTDERIVYTGSNYLKRRIYSFLVYQYRMAKSFFKVRSLGKYSLIRKMNQAFKLGWLNSHYRKNYPDTFAFAETSK